MFTEPKNKELYLIGMDWLGLVGNMFTVYKIQNITYIHHCGDLIVPTTLHSINFFKETLNNLFIFKHHLENLEKMIEPEQARLDYYNQLNKLRPLDSKRRLESVAEPIVFFTPVTKRNKTRMTIDEDVV